MRSRSPFQPLWFCSNISGLFRAYSTELCWVFDDVCSLLILEISFTFDFLGKLGYLLILSFKVASEGAPRNGWSLPLIPMRLLLLTADITHVKSGFLKKSILQIRISTDFVNLSWVTVNKNDLAVIQPVGRSYSGCREAPSTEDLFCSLRHHILTEWLSTRIRSVWYSSLQPKADDCVEVWKYLFVEYSPSSYL